MKKKHAIKNKKMTLSEIKKSVGKGKYQDVKKPVQK
jgi:hypothetical protein